MRRAVSAETVSDLQTRVAAGRAALLRTVRDVPDFPGPGTLFKDIAPMLADGQAFAQVIDAMTASIEDAGLDHVVGVESRGFLLAAPVALRLGVGLIIVRKAGKLPGPLDSITYELEYGRATLQMAHGALTPGSRVAIIDDVLATGGTLAATAELLERAGAQVARVAVLLELAGLAGPILGRFDVRSLAVV